MLCNNHISEQMPDMIYMLFSSWLKTFYVQPLLLYSNVTSFTFCQGPVVQSIVSLMSLLRGQLSKCFTTLQPNTLIFFVEKMREAFAVKASLIFSTKNIDIFEKFTSKNLTKC